MSWRNKLNWLIIGGLVILVLIIGIIIKRKLSYSEDSFLDRAVGNINSGCAKLLQKIRGC
jgi:hypothetical protein